LLKPISIDKLIEAVGYVLEIKEKENNLQKTILKHVHVQILGKLQFHNKLDMRF
jgi:two-component system LytT family response regulator